MSFGPSMRRNRLIIGIGLAILPLSPALAVPDRACKNSSILLPVHVPMEAIAARLNEVVPLSLSGDEGYLKWSVARQPIELKASQNTLHAVTQLAASVTVHVKTPWGKVEETLDRIKADVTVSMRPRLTSDWRVRPNGAAKVKLTKASGKIGPIRYSVRGLLQIPLDKSVSEEVRRLNEYLESSTLIEDQAAKFWSGLHRPIQVNRQPPVWLSLSPRGVSAGQPSIDERGVDLVVGIEADTALATGVKPSAGRTRLPSLDLAPHPPAGHFNIALPIVVDWKTANKAIADRLREKPIVIEQGSGRLVVERVTLGGADDGKMLVTARFSVQPTGLLGKVLAWIDRRLSGWGLDWRLSDALENQTVRMTAMPRLDGVRKTVSVHQVKLTASSSDPVLLATDVYGWINDRTIESLVEQKAVVDLSKQISNGEREAQARIDKITGDLGKHGVKMNVSVQNVTSLGPVQITPSALLTKLCVAAKVGMQVQRIDRF